MKKTRNIAIPFEHESIHYVLHYDDKGKIDLLKIDTSLKSQKLAKETAMTILTSLGYENELSELPDHKDRDLPHTDNILELLKEVIENETK